MLLFLVSVGLVPRGGPGNEPLKFHGAEQRLITFRTSPTPISFQLFRRIPSSKTLRFIAGGKTGAPVRVRVTPGYGYLLVLHHDPSRYVYEPVEISGRELMGASHWPSKGAYKLEANSVRIWLQDRLGLNLPSHSLWEISACLGLCLFYLMVTLLPQKVHPVPAISMVAFTYWAYHSIFFTPEFLNDVGGHLLLILALCGFVSICCVWAQYCSDKPSVVYRAIESAWLRRQRARAAQPGADSEPVAPTTAEWKRVGREDRRRS